MSSYQVEKQLVLNYYKELDSAAENNLSKVMERYLDDYYIWRGFHPFNEQSNAKAVSELFWQPLRHAFRHMQRRMDIFMAGRNEIDGFESVWVTSMGHLVGLFDNEWLGIAPTGKMIFLRYCEFNKIEHGKITETAMFFDIPHLMMQAGLQPFPSQTAAHLVQPGPMTRDGLMFEGQDPKEGEKTLAAIDFMVNDMRDWKDDKKATSS